MACFRDVSSSHYGRYSDWFPLRIYSQVAKWDYFYNLVLTKRIIWRCGIANGSDFHVMNRITSKYQVHRTDLKTGWQFGLGKKFRWLQKWPTSCQDHRNQVNGRLLPSRIVTLYVHASPWCACNMMKYICLHFRQQSCILRGPAAPFGSKIP